MAGFQQIVFGLAILVVIVFTVFAYFMIKNGIQNQTYPPTTFNCPDYWIDVCGNGSMCLNANDVPYNASCPTDASANTQYTFDMSSNSFMPGGGITVSTFYAPDFTNYTPCQKYQWAQQCGTTQAPLSWDGITYGVPNPCAS